MLNGYMEIPEAKFSCGQPAGEVGIAAADQAYLNHVIRENLLWRTVIEIGTSHGVTALLLGLTMRCRGGQLLTIDNGDCRPESVRNGWLENMTVLRGDELPNGQPHPTLVRAIQAAPCLLICDGGDKIAEVSQYAPLLGLGSAFVVHDWAQDSAGGAASLAQIRHIVETDAWAPLCRNEAERWNSYFRGWIRQ